MKKALSFLALTGLSLGLVGCGAQDASEVTSSNSSTTEETPTQEVITLRVATHDVCGEDPNSPKIGSEGCMSIESAEARAAVLESIEEEHGIRFEFVEANSDDIAEALTGWNLAGNAEAEIVRVNSSVYTGLANSGNIAEISSYIDTVSKELDIFGTDIPYKLGQLGNENYGVARDNMIYPELLVYDIDILEDAGMEEMPHELWAKGEWTFDTAREYFKKVQQYADTSSELAYAFGSEAQYIFRSALAANGVRLIQDGQSNVMSEEVYETMNFLDTLRNDGSLKVYSVPYAAEDEKWKYALTEEKNVWAAAQSAWTAGNPESEVKEGDTGAVAFTLLDSWRLSIVQGTDKRYGVVPFPENSEDAFLPSSRGDMYVIPKSVDEDKLEVITKAMALLISAHLSPDNVEKFATNNFTEQDNAVEIINYLQEIAEIDPYLDYSGGHNWSYTSFVTEWFNDPTTLTTHLETLDEILTANLNK